MPRACSGESRGPRGFEQSRIGAARHARRPARRQGGRHDRGVRRGPRPRRPAGAGSSHGGIRVWFAREYPDADSLIEELVEDDTAPTHLVVVSSDRRLQAAARRRRARAVSCEAVARRGPRARRSREPPGRRRQAAGAGPGRGRVLEGLLRALSAHSGYVYRRLGGGKSRRFAVLRIVAGARIRSRLLERSPTPLPTRSGLPTRRYT